jgi:hypothetical protein
MPRANHEHRIEDISFREQRIHCVCGWTSRDVPVEEAWMTHRRTYGLTQKN